MSRRSGYRFADKDLPMDTARGGDREMDNKMTIRNLLDRCAKVAPLAAVLAASLALSACDKCFDFPWDRPGSCKNLPSPNDH